jgi:GNAT superfamily N-acetyltransferase
VHVDIHRMTTREALGARLGHRLVGSVRARLDGRAAHVGRLSVAPDLQGRGIGARLLAEIESALAGRVDRFELFTGARSDDNLRLYARCGYQVIADHQTPAGPGLTYLEKRA